MNNRILFLFISLFFLSGLSSNAHNDSLEDGHVHGPTSFEEFRERQGEQQELENLTTEELVVICCNPLHAQQKSFELLDVRAFEVITEKLNSEDSPLDKQSLIILACKKFSEIGIQLETKKTNNLVDAIVENVVNFEGLALRACLGDLKAIKHPKIKALAEKYMLSEDYWIKERAESLFVAQTRTALNERIESSGDKSVNGRMSKPFEQTIPPKLKQGSSWFYFFGVLVVLLALISGVKAWKGRSVS